MRGAALVFRLEAQLCAIGLEQVGEVMRPLPVRPVRGVPPYVAGISMIRGTPVPVIQAALLRGDLASPPVRFVTVSGGPSMVALAVGEVLGVYQIDLAGLADLPPLLLPANQPDTASFRLGTFEDEPLLFLRDARIIPGEVWDELTAQLADRKLDRSPTPVGVG